MLGIGVSGAAKTATEATAATRPAQEAAFAQARAMRAFDPHLTDSQIAAIAHGIETAIAASASMNPHSRTLRNGDPP